MAVPTCNMWNTNCFKRLSQVILGFIIYSVWHVLENVAISCSHWSSCEPCQRALLLLFSKGCFSVKCLLSLGRRYRAIHIYRTHCFCGVFHEQLTVETMNRAVLSHSTLLTGLVPVKIRPIWLSPEVPSNPNHASSVASANDSCLALWNVKMLPVFRVMN